MSDRRTLTLLPASATVISNMIGTGIFTTTGLMAGMGAGAGDILVAWLLGGVIALCGALCYGEVGANLPESGGEYYYLSRLMHPSLGFVSGIVSLAVGFAAPIAAAAIAMNLYISSAVPGWPVPWMAAATVIGIALLHGYDLHLGSRVQTAITAVKVLLILIFIGGVVIAAPDLNPRALLDIRPNFLISSPFAVVLVFVSFAYAGWNASGYIGTELKNPERTLPLSLLIGTVIVTCLYMLLNLSYLLVVPLNELANVEQVGFVVGTRLWGGTAANVISMLIALTLVCPISAMLLVGPRIAEAMARDGFISPAIARLNHRNVPSRAVALLAAIAALIAFTSSFGSLLIYVGFVLNIFAALTVVCLFRLRRQNRALIKICVGYPVTPIIFLAFTVWMTVWSIQSEPRATLAGVATVGLGYLAYRLRVKKARLVEDAR